MALRAPKRERERPNRLQATEEGAYLTDGVRLFRVLPHAAHGKVWLEDCANPGRFAQELDVGDVTKRMTLVRPEGGGR